MVPTDAPTPPQALLLIAPGCAHCPVVLEALSRLIKEGRLGSLEVINIQAHPKRATEVGARSAPWTRIGPFSLEGLHSYEELAGWAGHAAAGTGFGEYYSELLGQQKLAQALEMAHRAPDSLLSLPDLLADADTPMGVRIGIGALIEDLQPARLEPLVPALVQLTRAAEPQTRADACHYLGLSGDPRAEPVVRNLLDDHHPDVREIAEDTLKLLRGGSDNA